MSPLVPVLAFAALAIGSMVDKSATFDEAYLLVSGAHYLRTGDPSFNAENPPLLKAFLALPTVLCEHSELPAPPASVRATYRVQRGLGFANAYLYSFEHPRRVLLWCRCMAVLLGCGLGLVVYSAARRAWSRQVALVLLWVYSLSPNVLANTRLVALDLGSALFLLLSVLAVYGLLERGGPWRLAGAGLALGAALSTKHATTPVLVVVALLAVGYSLLVPRYRSRRGRFMLELGAAAVLALIIVNASYGFAGFGQSLAGATYHSPLLTRVAQLPWLGGLPLPVPSAYVRGFDIAAYWNQAGEFNIFLGTLYREGGSWWYYYLVELALRAPLPLLVGLLLSAAILVRGIDSDRLRTLFFAVPPGVLLVIFSVATYRQLGLRYILPIWPFMILGLGFLVDHVLQRPDQRPLRATAVVLCVWYLLSSLLVYPHYLTYFNELAGGSARGWRLADANYDWGQDLPLLARWQERHGWPGMYVLSFGPTPPEEYGVIARPWGTRPLPDYLAIGATMRLLLADDPLVQLITGGQEPVARLGNTLFIFEIEPELEMPVR